jgi:hypothetical protein
MGEPVVAHDPRVGVEALESETRFSTNRVSLISRRRLFAPGAGG